VTDEEIFVLGKAQMEWRRECTIVHMTNWATTATPHKTKRSSQGAIAQLGERLPCTQEVGSLAPPFTSD